VVYLVLLFLLTCFEVVLLVLLVQVIGHSNFSSIRASTCIYKGESNITLSPWRGNEPKTFSVLGFTAR